MSSKLISLRKIKPNAKIFQTILMSSNVVNINVIHKIKLDISSNTIKILTVTHIKNEDNPKLARIKLKITIQ